MIIKYNYLITKKLNKIDLELNQIQINSNQDLILISVHELIFCFIKKKEYIMIML